MEQLPTLFREHGLQDVRQDTHYLGDQFRAMWMQSNLAGYDDLVDDNLVELGKADEIRKFSAALQAEIQKGIAIETPFTCVVGQKNAT